jgi:cystathionine beta-lyase
VTHSSGVINALHIALKSLTQKGDGVLIQPPVYHPFYRVINLCSLTTVINPLKLDDNKYVTDFEDLEFKLKKHKPKAMILCNPHNPTGKVFTKDELSLIGRLCMKYKTKVISDEIHCDLTYRGIRHVPFAGISDEFKANTVMCTAPSKTFNLAGLFTSNIIIPDDGLRKKFVSASDEIGLHPMNIFGMTACLTGYKFGESWLAALLDYLEGNLNFAAEFIKNNIPQIGFIKPEGTYFLWIDFRKLGLQDHELESLINDDAKVRLNHGYIFGKKHGSGFARMNLACPKILLKDAFERLENTVKRFFLKS